MADDVSIGGWVCSTRTPGQFNAMKAVSLWECNVPFDNASWLLSTHVEHNTTDHLVSKRMFTDGHCCTSLKPKVKKNTPHLPTEINFS
jgi:hypothetical protein